MSDDSSATANDCDVSGLSRGVNEFTPVWLSCTSLQADRPIKRAGVSTSGTFTEHQKIDLLLGEQIAVFAKPEFPQTATDFDGHAPSVLFKG